MDYLVLQAFFKEAAGLQAANMPKERRRSLPDAPTRVLRAGEAKLETLKKKERVEQTKNVLRPVDKARPYAHRALIGALPGGWLGGWTSKDPSPKRRAAGAAIGASISVGDKLLDNLSKKKEFKKVLQSYQKPLDKAAAMASMGSTDLRQTTPGLKKPKFPTAGSKNMARAALNKGNKSFTVGMPGPTVMQQATRT